jgi:hypothetical protein
MAEQRAKPVIVSPKLIQAAQGDPVRVRVTDPEHRSLSEDQVILVPMSEVYQSLVRALRAAFAAFVVLALAGLIAQATTGEAIPPFVRLTTPQPVTIVLIALMVALLVFLFWLLWNGVEFLLHVNEHHPRWRA